MLEKLVLLAKVSKKPINERTHIGDSNLKTNIYFISERKGKIIKIYEYNYFVGK